jgi:RNA polymerase sigma-70 factor (sigma-E family)
VEVEDPEAFCEREYGRLVGTLTLYTGSRDLAQDLAQEALARVCARWDRVSEMNAPGAWVHQVALNLANSHWARRRRRQQAEGRALAEPVVSALAWDEVLSVRDAVAGLPVRQRSALVLRYYLDLPVLEVARLMHCRAGTVKALTHQALATLRIRLAVTDLEECRDAT